MRWSTVRTIRWALVGVGVALGVALIALGAVVIGVVLVVMAGLRAALLVALERRARAMRSEPVTGRRSGVTLRRLARKELDVAAGAIGIQPADLQRAVEDGRTISAVAADAGVPSRRVVEAVVRDARTKVDRAVEAGNVAPVRARVLRQRLPYWAEHFVLSTPAMLVGAPPA